MDFDRKGLMGGYGSRHRKAFDAHRPVEFGLVLDATAIPRPIEAGNEGEIDLTNRAMKAPRSGCAATRASASGSPSQSLNRSGVIP
jgi:hypothetical protein